MIDTSSALQEGTWDLVVVGHGFAGLTAARAYQEEAARQGWRPRVAVLERASEAERGGSTRWTTANLQMTREGQLRPFWGDRVRRTAGELANDRYIESFYRYVPETINWIQGHGVDVERIEFGALPDGSWRLSGGGKALMDALEPAIKADGGSLFYETKAMRLIRGTAGSIEGLEVETATGERVVMVTAAVVLACGGFEGNPEMLARYFPNAHQLKTVSPGTRNNKGDGIRMAIEIGADTAGQFDGAHLEPCDPRSPGVEPIVSTYRYGILVNQSGKRFIDEAYETLDIHFDTVANTIFREQGNLAYAINDSAQATHPGFHNLSEVEPITAASIEELAVALGIDPVELRRTVDVFNASIDDRVDFDPNVPLDGRSTRGITPAKSNNALALKTGPFMAWPVSAQICFTYGGLKVDGESRVIDTDGRAIPGLYAAGEIAGIFYEQYPSGTSGLRSMTFGRRAGVTSAQELIAIRRDERPVLA